MSQPNIKKKNRILVVRPDRMGDVILSTPTLTALQQKFPDAEIGMMVAPYTRDVIDGHPDLDFIMIYDDNGKHQGFSGFFTLVKDLRDQTLARFYLLHPRFRLALAAFLAGIPVRVGTSYRAYSFLFNQPVKLHRRNSGKHEAELNLQMISSDYHMQNFDLKFHIPPWAEKRIHSLLAEHQIKSPFVVLHPGSGGSARDWPWQRFAQLAHHIGKLQTVTVILTGSKNEKELIDKIQNYCDYCLYRLDGQLSIKELAALYNRAAGVVANSTGPLHLAVAVGTSVVGLYCSLPACHPNRWGPYRRPDSVIMPESCENYPVHESNCTEKNCMDSISVETVLSKLIEKIEDKI
jgi:lipopolysaccharide heptosyltransferase II